ncbi:MAG TPA: exosortase J [Terracidiphilus sp.]|nr:exosortase J [Terracidiphilus sp.]
MKLGNEATIEATIPLSGTLDAESGPTERQRSDNSCWTLPLVWSGVAVTAAVGCIGFYREIFLLWTVWTSDSLRSIGILIPPLSILLTLRVWKQLGWERKGSWWGFALIGLAFGMSALRQFLLVNWNVGTASVSLLPASSPLFFYWTGIIVLFAGWRVGRQAAFPLVLMLLATTVPSSVNVIDLQLQSVSAHVARGFATLIGFRPTTPALRLMFSPDFGMFIAPGCDGIRGAVTMGYIALILGYLKRVSLRRWILYVSGAVLLGYVFNFARLCLLVIYYKIALGHSSLEQVAKQADYVIGSSLFLIATVLFLRVARLKDDKKDIQAPFGNAPTTDLAGMWSLVGKGAAFAVAVTLVASVQAQGLKTLWADRNPLRWSPDLVPKQVGDFILSRTWYEQVAGIPVMETAAYSAPGSSEITLGIWVGHDPYPHNSQNCWMARGLSAGERALIALPTAYGQNVPFDISFYNDGATQTVVATALCSPRSCRQYPIRDDNKLVVLLLTRPNTATVPGEGGHPVAIIVRIDTPVKNASESAAYQDMSAELRRFVSGLDLSQLSKAFQ